MTKRHAQIAAALCAAQVLVASSALANNIQVTNVTLQNINTAADTANVQFNVSWENSWRVTAGPANWDAAWVFVKYHTGDLIWKSANLDVADASHVVPAGATLDMGVNGTRGMGAFVYRSAVGTGNNTWNNLKLRWNYGMDGVSDAALVTLDVHAIEMVYVPSGPFFLGDGVSRTPGTADLATLIDGTTPANNAAFSVINGGPTNVGPVAGALSASGLLAGAYKPVPTTFPNGFDAYYIMKYEGSQGQWAGFVNTTSKLPPIAYNYFEILNPQVGATPPRDQLLGRQVFFSSDLPPPAIIPGPVPPNPVPPVPTRPIVQAKFPDRAFVSSEAATLAYLDWSGLRPMTEFEYEKTARGPVAPVAGEFAWGTADIALLTYGALFGGTLALGNDGQPGENAAINYNRTGGNAWVRATILTLAAGGPILGPARVGMFARPAAEYEVEIIPGLPIPPPNAPPRIQSGSGYYGVMDLTGNVSELAARWAFPLAASTTPVFSSEHGDGLLGANGLHNVPGWALTPAGATFYGLRGGSFADVAAPVSQRSVLVAGTLTNPGIRGVRTAPAP